MKTCIAFFSRDGSTKLAAEILAEKLKADLIELIDPVNYRGVIGFLRGGFRASSGVSAKLDAETLKKIASYDTVVAATPIWASKTTPAFNAILTEAALSGKRFVALTVQGDLNAAGHDQRVSDMKEKLAAAGAVFGGCYPVGSAKFGRCADKADLEKKLEGFKIE